jgi:hypothetical protein
MDESRRGTLAEATDVIGSQSRQEAAGIKPNRYAFAWATPRKSRAFSRCDDAGHMAAVALANRQWMTKT